MLSKAKVMQRFGKLPETAAEARANLHTLAVEMSTHELLELVKRIDRSPNHANPVYIWGKQAAQQEIASRRQNKKA